MAKPVGRNPMGRHPVWASFWQFDGSDRDAGEEPQVEAMEAALSVDRTDVGKVMIVVRGKPRMKRWEPHESVWLELDDVEALALIARLSEALRVDLPPGIRAAAEG